LELFLEFNANLKKISTLPIKNATNAIN
jgi:hypothetical protein